jgi:hypothetical protein
MPALRVQTNATVPTELESARPTTVDPSGEIANARLCSDPLGNVPKPMNMAARVAVGVTVDVSVGVTVDVPVDVADAVTVEVAAGVAVGVAADVAVFVACGVRVAVVFGVGDDVGVRVACELLESPHPAKLDTLSAQLNASIAL